METAQQTTDVSSRHRLIPLLGALHAMAPMTIDMYLPSLPLLERVFRASTAEVQQTLASFFLGFACGQSLWGPVTDRFGRRKPLYFSLLLFLVTSAGCALAPSIGFLTAMRLFQAVGACGSAVIARAMVRDMFPPAETRRAFSTLLMLNAVSPAVAPLAGGVLLAWLGWQSIFWTLTMVAAAGFLLVHFVLPETLRPGTEQPLHPRHILSTYWYLLRDRTFLGASLVTGVAGAGLFTYIAGSPFVFIELYKVSPQQFAILFAINAAGIIITSLLNGRVLHGMPAGRVLLMANLMQLASGLLLVISAITGIGGIVGIAGPLFFYVSSMGFTFPNGSAIAMGKHGKIAGTASALLGTNQFILAALTVTGLGMFHLESARPMAWVIASCGCLAVLLNMWTVGPNADPASQ